MKTIKTQIKTIMLLLLLALSTNIYAQNEIKKNRMFVRVYNLDGKKINKGYVVSIGDTLLGLKRRGNDLEINVRNIGSIKTKRSAGHNLLIGSATGAAAGAILGAVSVEETNDLFGDSIYNISTVQGAVTGGLMGAAAGAAVGGITIAFKNSETFVINGDLGSWGLFQKRMQK
jgi:hypothetical protein